MPSCPEASRLSREDVLSCILANFSETPFCTTDVASKLGAREYAVRGTFVWLKAGGIVTEGQTVRRVDRSGRPYVAHEYRWTGIETVSRVAQDRDARRRDREEAQASVGRDLAMSWLSRRW